jgi:hypothetical protein
LVVFEWGVVADVSLVVFERGAQFFFAKAIALDDGVLEVTRLGINIAQESLALLRLAHSVRNNEAERYANNEQKDVLHGHSQNEDMDNVFK